MTETLEWFADLDWVAIGEIIVIDILLGGDNALLIALACRNLPAKQRRTRHPVGQRGRDCAARDPDHCCGGAAGLPFLKLIGGLMLLWIGVKLIAPPDDADAHGDIQASDKLWAAIKTIIVADFVMSLDNVIAIAGAAEQADAEPAHRPHHLRPAGVSAVHRVRQSAHLEAARPLSGHRPARRRAARLDRRRPHHRRHPARRQRFRTTLSTRYLVSGITAFAVVVVAKVMQATA